MHDSNSFDVLLFFIFNEKKFYQLDLDFPSFIWNGCNHTESPILYENICLYCLFAIIDNVSKMANPDWLNEISRSGNAGSQTGLVCKI